MPEKKSTEGQYTTSGLPQGSHSKPELRGAKSSKQNFF